MLNSFWIAVLVGAILGFLSGLGIGGGSLLLLWLTMISGMAQEQARIINLMFFIPCASIACLFRWKDGKLKAKNALPPMLTGLCGAFLGNMVSQGLDTDLFRKFFGIFFIVCGIREICYRPRKLR